jgi:hypothetical protein
MAIKTLEERKKQQKLMIIGGVIILITFLVLYFGFWNSKTNIPSTDVQPGAEGDQSGIQKRSANILSEEKLKKIDLNTDFLVQTILPILKIHGAIHLRHNKNDKTKNFFRFLDQ